MHLGHCAGGLHRREEGAGLDVAQVPHELRMVPRDAQQLARLASAPSSPTAGWPMLSYFTNL